jgi:hypothetical protein
LLNILFLKPPSGSSLKWRHLRLDPEGLNEFTQSNDYFLYVQALYLRTLTNDPKEILNSDAEMAIRIQIISSLVTSSKLTKSLKKGMLKSVGEGGMEKLKPQLDLLESLLSSQATRENDFFNLIYSPKEESILVYKNDKLEGKIEGFEFKKAFFGIWLSDNPVDEKLKDSLLNMFR